MKQLFNFMRTSHSPLARWLGALLVLGLCALAAPASRGADGSPPDRLTYQGYLVDGNGAPLAPDSPKNYDVVFRIYGAPTGGTPKWSEQHTVTVDNGFFSILLGEGTAVASEARPALSAVFSGSDASDRYIGMTVKGIGSGSPPGDLTVLPRLQFLTSPYSYLALNSVNAANSANLVNQDGGVLLQAAVGGVQLSGALTASGSIKGAQIEGDGSLLSALNGAHITTGTVADARLSANIPRLDAVNTFTKETYLSDSAIYLRGGADHNHSLAYNAGLDGPRLAGYAGGALSTTMTSPKDVVVWNQAGQVGIGTGSPAADLDVGGHTGDGALRTVLARLAEGDTTGDGTFLGVKAWTTSQGSHDGLSFSLEHSFYGEVNNSIKFFRGGDQTGGYMTMSASDGSERVRISSGGSMFKSDGDTQLSLKKNSVDRYWLIGTDFNGNLGFGPSVGTSGYISYADGNYHSNSDLRLKKGVEPIAGALGTTLKLRPVSYQYKHAEPGSTRSLGFIAQEVEAVLPEVTGENGGYKSVAYSELVPVAIGAIQELHSEAERKQRDIEALRSEVQALRELVQKLASDRRDPAAQ